MEAYYQQFKNQGLLSLLIVGEDQFGGDAGQLEATQWRDSYGQTGVVVADPGWASANTWYPFGVDQGGGSWSIGLPGTMLLGPGMEIAVMGQPSQAQIQAALP